MNTQGRENDLGRNLSSQVWLLSKLSPVKVIT